MKKLLTILALALSLNSVLLAASGTPRKPVEEVKSVVEAFRTAILKKDKAQFTQLLLSEDIPWIGSMDNVRVAQMRQNYPDFKPQKPSSHGGAIPFIDFIVGDPSPKEEKFWNIKVDTDGTIASVHFDYSFHHGKTKTNWGKEAWQLIYTDGQWKIASVVWSVITEPKPAPPQRVEVPVDAAQLQAYTGTYQLNEKAAFVIGVHNGRLSLKFEDDDAHPLYHAEGDHFFDKAYGNTQEFVRDASGAITHLHIELSGRTLKATRR